MRPLDRPANSRRQILNAASCRGLDLIKGSGCWYFIYDDGEECLIRAVRVKHLKDKTLEEWADLGFTLCYVE